MDVLSSLSCFKVEGVCKLLKGISNCCIFREIPNRKKKKLSKKNHKSVSSIRSETEWIFFNYMPESRQ